MTTNANRSDLFRAIDALWQARLARLTLGISPASVTGAVAAWMTHLAQAPGKMMELASYPGFHTQEYWRCFLSSSAHTQNGEDTDPRFKASSWHDWPWRTYKYAFQLAEDWSSVATQDVPGLDARSQRIVSFGARQLMDALCPANFPWTNPELAGETIAKKGANLARGAHNFLHDFHHMLMGLPADDGTHFQVGRNLAVTPGNVVFRNELMELIQYTPQTPLVNAEPILITPAWIMKYYILDLSPANSLVRWLVEKGHTVFMISWKNPNKDDAHLTMDDYQNLGIMAALDVVSKTCGKNKIHLAGYCLGGTLAMITAATMSLNGDKRLKSLTLLAAQGDFTDAGELMLFITPSQVSFLQNIMRAQGYLDTKQMAGAFQMLRSYDLIWSKIINDYLHGMRRGTVDFMAWNADTTRMPCEMHSAYLERLFLNNEFAAGHYTVEGKAVAPENIHVPIFAVGTDHDHVAPWESVYKVHLMVGGEITFVLAKGGHNVGIVSEPGHPGRFFLEKVRNPGDPYMDPETWRKGATRHPGSWWLAWDRWLEAYATQEKVTPPAPLTTLEAAPGTYVLQR